MANNKVITADEAIALIRDNDVVTTTGFVQSCIPEALARRAGKALRRDRSIRATSR